MIALASDCILLRRENGESEPLTLEGISVEVVTEGEVLFDETFVKEASAAVLHYFKNEAGRDSITLGEFAEALEKVLQGFISADTLAKGSRAVAEADLHQLATESGKAFELTFFPRLRDEVRTRLRQSPKVLRFRGLRGCVKELTGSRRWNARCQTMHEQIVQFLRECLSAEPHPDSCSLVVE